MPNNLKNKISLLAGVVFATGVFFVIASVAAAQVSIDFPTNFAGFSSQDLKTTIENIVRIVLGFTGVVFLAIILYGGFTWMTSGGDEKKIARAKKIIVSSVVGLMITLSAYAIASFVIRSIDSIGQPGPLGGGGGPGSGGLPVGVALGAGVLESHYPGRNATGIPRNTNIFITFKEEMNVDTICTLGASPGNPTAVNIATVEVIDADSKVTSDPLDPDDNDILDIIDCEPTDITNTTFKLDPGGPTPPSSNHLGISSGDIRYTIKLGSGIETVNDPGKSALGSLGYNWQFTVSTELDETPPRIREIYPLLGSQAPPNAIVRISFSEAIDPTTAAGLYSEDVALPVADRFTNIQLENPVALQPPILIEGVYIMANQFQTVEFISDTPCLGTPENSCGEKIFCLPYTDALGVPQAQNIVAHVVAGRCADDPLDPANICQTDSDCGGGVTCQGIMDMAGNRLDGEYDPLNPSLPTGDGVPGGDMSWNFDTDEELDLDPPVMEKRVPIMNSFDAVLTDPVIAEFDDFLSASSVNTKSYLFSDTICSTDSSISCETPSKVTECANTVPIAGVCIGVPNAGFPVNYWTSMENFDSDGDAIFDKSRILLHHDAFQPLKAYVPLANSQIRDANQNCYNPAVCLGAPGDC